MYTQVNEKNKSQTLREKIIKLLVVFCTIHIKNLKLINTNTNSMSEPNK